MYMSVCVSVWNIFGGKNRQAKIIQTNNTNNNHNNNS